MKKKIMAVLAVIAAVLGFGFATNTAMADDYGATVTYGGTTATVTFPAGTFRPYSSRIRTAALWARFLSSTGR